MFVGFCVNVETEALLRDQILAGDEFLNHDDDDGLMKDHKCNENSEKVCEYFTSTIIGFPSHCIIRAVCCFSQLYSTFYKKFSLPKPLLELRYCSHETLHSLAQFDLSSCYWNSSYRSAILFALAG